MRHKVDDILKIKSYYHFIKAVNYYLVANNFENRLFIDDNCSGYEAYKKELLKEDFVGLLHDSGVPFMDNVVEFAKEINREMNAVIVFSEKELCGNAAQEIYNMAMLTGKLGKTANGIIALKEKNNSQGLSDMGITPAYGVGAQPVGDSRFRRKMIKKWHVDKLPETVHDNLFPMLEAGKVKNLFIFGEDPLGCAVNKVKVAGWLSVAEFVVVQDIFLTDTAMEANLILPASLPFESGGTVTNTQKIIQTVDKVFEPVTGKTNVEQLSDMLHMFGLDGAASTDDVLTEAISLLPGKGNRFPLPFISTHGANHRRLFNYGCDIINKRFEEEFKEAFE
jgi:formate dehydrogenase major subunit